MRNVVGVSFSGTDFKGKTVISSSRQVSLKKVFETQIWLPVCLFVSLPVFLHAYLPACLPACLSFCFSVSLCQSGFVLLCLLASLSNSVFLSPWFLFLRLFFDFFHRYSFPSLSMLCKVLVSFLWTVSASLLILCCFFNFFNQIFGFLLFGFLLFSVVLLVLYRHICYGGLKTPFI